MEDNEEEEKNIEGLVQVEGWKPGGSVNLSHGGITRKNLQSNQNEENRTAESNKKVRKHLSPKGSRVQGFKEFLLLRFSI